MQSFETDVIVVGCGAAGLTAALAALEAGVRVINLERSSYDERGGNTRWTEANLLLKFNQDNFELQDAFLQGYMTNSGFHSDPDFVAETVRDYAKWHPNVKTAPFLDAALLHAFAENIPPTLAWLQDYGVRVDTRGQPFPLCLKILPFCQIYGGGLALIEALTPAIEARGGELLCETTATELIVDDMGRVCGVRGTGKRNEPVEIRAAAVVLASGGFEGNPQMLAQYGGPNTKYLKPVAKGGYYNKGEGLRMALALNAAPAGDWSDCHHQMVDPRSTQPEALVNIWPCGVLVNSLGKRFMDEAPNNLALWQEEPGKAVLAQPGGIGFLIYDQQLESASDQTWRAGLRTDQGPIVADTLTELADALGMPPAVLIKTIDDYNVACVDSDRVDMSFFDAQTFSFGGCGTQGLEPPKSNFARRIEKGPFYCYPVMSSICFTYGGLRVTPDAEVINYSGEVIPGLYAAGETVGMHYGVYTGATSVLRGLTFGRLAGRHAAAQIV